MNTNFDSLPLLNNYLNSHIERMDQCEDKHAEVNHLIQVVRQNEGLLKAESAPSDALVKFLKSVTSLKEVEAENQELTQVTTAAMSVFTHLGKENIDSSLNAIHQLKEAGSDIYYQTLAGWINEKRVKITSLHLSKDEMLKLAPYLTYLSIKGGNENEFTDEFIGELLENTKKLEDLKIFGCPNFNQPLPKRMESLKTLAIQFCRAFNQPLPEGMVKLYRLDIQDCSFNQKLPEGLSELYTICLPNYPEGIAMEFLSSRYESDIQQGLTLAYTFDIRCRDLIQYSLTRKFPKQAEQIDIWLREVDFRLLNPSSIPFLGEDSVKNNPLLQLFLFQIYSRCDPAEQAITNKLLTPFVKNPETLAPFTSKQGADAFLDIFTKSKNLKSKDRDAFLAYLNETKNLPVTLNYYQLLAGWINEKKISLNNFDFRQIDPLKLAPYLTYLDLQGCNGDEFIGNLLARTENLTVLRIRGCKLSESAFAQLKNTKKLQFLSIETEDGVNLPLPADLGTLQTLIINSDGFNQPLPPVMHEIRELHITSLSFNHPLPEWVGGLRKLTIACPALPFSLPAKLGAMEELVIHCCKGLTFESSIKPLLEMYKSAKERGLELALHVVVGDEDDNTVISSRDLPMYERFIGKNPADDDDIIAMLKKIDASKLGEFFDRKDIPLVNEAVLSNDPLQQLYLYNIGSHIPTEKIPHLLGALAAFVKTPMQEFQKTCYAQIAKFGPLESFLSFIANVTPLPEIQDKNSYYQLVAAWMAKERIPIKSLNLTDAEMLELAPHLDYLDLTDGNRMGENATFTDQFVGSLLEKTEHLIHLQIAFSNIDGSAFDRFKNTEHLGSLVIGSCDRLNHPLPERMPKLHTLQISCRSYNHPLPQRLDALRTCEIFSDSYNHPLPEWASQLKSLQLGCILFNHPLPSKMDNLLRLVIDGCSAFNHPLPDKLDNLILLALKDLELFNQPLPERLDNLESLEIRGLGVFNQPLPKGMSSLQRLTVAESDNYNQPIPEGMDALRRIVYPASNMGAILRFILPILHSNRERAFALAPGLLPGKKISPKEHLEVFDYFIGQNLDQIDAIAEWVEKIKPEELLPVMKMNASENVIPVVEGDPLQKLFIFGICTKMSQHQIPHLKPLLEQIIRTPMDPPLQQFYERILTMENPGDLLQAVITAGPSRIAEINSRYEQDREKLFKFLPFLIHADSEKNLEILDKTGQLDLFLDRFSARYITAVSIMGMADLFTEDGDENAKTIRMLSDLETELNNLKGVMSIAEMPWANEAESLSQTAVGKAFMKLHFNEIVTEPQLQEFLLRAFPPSKRENLALYPMESSLRFEELVIHVVPSLPIADAPRLLRLITESGDFNRLKIYYYGSPGVDASGLGRQFVSEVMQGYVINQGHLFTKTAEGDMYPYDPTHKLDVHANRESYKALGKFLAIAAKLGYPTGKILSEKALNCMLANDLLLDEFDMGALAKMDPVAFIKFMREASIEDEESVNLYEEVFINEVPEEALNAARKLNDLLGDDEVDKLIAGGIKNWEKICERLRTIWMADQAYSLNALHAIADGFWSRLPRKIGDHEIFGWDNVRNMGAAELSKQLQGELTPQYVKEHIHVRVIGGETPEKRQTADNVRKWTDEWIDANGDDPEKLANFVEAFSGARAMTKDIYLDINPAYHAIEAHTCFHRCDIPVGAKEGFLKLMWDDYATGNFRFNKG